MKTTTKTTKRYQCVCCGFLARKGNLYDGNFMCSACESDMIEEQEQRWLDEEWLEVSRISNQVWE